MTTFSAQVKDDLSHVKSTNRCCQLAELSAIMRMDGSLRIGRSRGREVELVTASAAIARKAITFLSDLFSLRATVMARRSRLTGAVSYVVSIPYQRPFDQALNELGILDERLSIRHGIAGRLVKKKCCAACYLRGLFLGGGSISEPGKPAHYEITTDNLAVAEGAQRLFARFEIGARMSSRKRNYAVYLKRHAAIAKALAVMGAYSALLEWEDMAIMKSIKTSVNRMVNCDTANMSKVVNASVKQIEAIQSIDRDRGLNRLPPALREAALSRLAHPQATIEELGKRCVPPLSKSAVYHRLRRLVAMAEGID